MLLNNQELPHKGQTLFTSKGKKFEVAQIGQGNKLNQLLDYAHGYFFTANKLLDQLKDDKEYFPPSLDESIQDALNLYAIPIIFLYRQYLELSLKEIYFEYSGVSPSEQIKTIKETGHDLKKILKYAKPIIESVLDDDEKEGFDEFEDYIIQFHNNDPNSFKYRYPFDKQLNSTIQSNRINLYTLKEGMGEVEDFLCDVMPRLDIKRETDLCNKNRMSALRLWEKNKLSEAISEYLEALKARQFMVGEEHFDVLIGNTEIGIIYLENEQFEEARIRFEKALFIYKRIENIACTNGFDISRVLNYLGLVYGFIGRYDNAIEYYTKASDTPCVDIEQIVIAHTGIARIYEKQNNALLAEGYFKKAIRLCEKSYGMEHKKTIETKKELQDFLDSIKY